MASLKTSPKLLVDDKTKKVLLAEAGNEFVDFVFSFLRFSISDVGELVSVGAMQTLGSVGRLYKSVADMGAAYLLPSADKSDLLEPKVLRRQGTDGRELLASFKMYTCSGRCLTVTVEAKAECPQCRQPMAAEMA